MDPLTILKLLARHRVVTVPLLALVVLMCGYVVFFGPRTYQATASYALINPDVPTAEELANNARLARLNSDNPYLRSSDPSLAVQVLIARLTSEATVEQVKSEGLSDEYTVERVANNSLMVVITGTGDTPAEAVATRERLGALLSQDLQAMQKVNGADDLYLFTALAVDVQSEAQEKVSSRLRLLIVVFFAGAVLLFGAVSIAESLARSGRGRPKAPRSPDPAADEPAWSMASMPQDSGWDWNLDDAGTGNKTRVESTTRPD